MQIPGTPKSLIKSAPKELQKLFFSQWNAKQNPNWHPEGNTLKHILVVLMIQKHILSGHNLKNPFLGLIKNKANLFKPYFKKTTIEQLSKSLETPAETLALIRSAINQAKPYDGKLDIDFNSIDTFADSINPEDFPSGNRCWAWKILQLD